MKLVGGTTNDLNLKMLSRLHHKWVPPFHLFSEILTLRKKREDPIFFVPKVLR